MVENNLLHNAIGLLVEHGFYIVLAAVLFLLIVYLIARFSEWLIRLSFVVIVLVGFFIFYYHYGAETARFLRKNIEPNQNEKLLHPKKNRIQQNPSLLQRERSLYKQQNNTQNTPHLSEDKIYPFPEQKTPPKKDRQPAGLMEF